MQTPPLSPNPGAAPLTPSGTVATLPPAPARVDGAPPAPEAVPAASVSQHPRTWVPDALALRLLLGSADAAGGPSDVPAAADRLFEALSEPVRQGLVPAALVQLLRSIIRPSAPHLEPEPLAALLRGALERSGLLLEARLAKALEQPDADRSALPLPADARVLVGQVLATLLAAARAPARSAVAAGSEGALAPGEQPGIPDAARVAAALGDRLLARQLETAAAAEATGLWRFDVPLAAGADRLRIEVEVERQPRGSRERGERGVLRLFVDQLRAGPIEVRLAWSKDRALDVTFYVATDATRDVLRAGLDDLRARLGGAFGSVRLEVCANPSRLVRRALPAAERPTPPTASVVSVRA